MSVIILYHIIMSWIVRLAHTTQPNFLIQAKKTNKIQMITIFLSHYGTHILTDSYMYVACGSPSRDPGVDFGAVIFKSMIQSTDVINVYVYTWLHRKIIAVILMNEDD